MGNWKVILLDKGLFEFVFIFIKDMHYERICIMILLLNMKFNPKPLESLHLFPQW